MKTTVRPSLLICLVVAGALIMVGSACQPATNTNTNATVNTNSTPANVNANLSTAPTTGIATREPEP